MSSHRILEAVWPISPGEPLRPRIGVSTANGQIEVCRWNEEGQEVAMLLFPAAAADDVIRGIEFAARRILGKEAA